MGCARLWYTGFDRVSESQFVKVPIAKLRSGSSVVELTGRLRETSESLSFMCDEDGVNRRLPAVNSSL